MKYFNTWKRANGSYTTQEWSAEEMFNYDLWRFLIICVIGSILVVLSSAVCLIARLWDFEANEKAPSYWGIVFSLYFVIDYWKGLPVTFILRLFEDVSTLKFMLACNVALLITHVLLLIFGDTIYFNTEEVEARKSTLTVVTIIVLVISFIIAKIII